MLLTQGRGTVLGQGRRSQSSPMRRRATKQGANMVHQPARSFCVGLQRVGARQRTPSRARCDKQLLFQAARAIIGQDSTLNSCVLQL